ncbi:MAG: hypothetical protein RMX35_28810 [Nostoc sp. DcaGUA01]|nr:hypothetical protein [Nostoc sp. DcaGUA01]
MVRVNCREYNRDSGGDGGNYPISGEWGVWGEITNAQCRAIAQFAILNV